MSGPLIYLIAGEPSGDLLAARLMTALRALTGGEVRFAGIGGEAMREQGMESLFPQADLAVRGFAEVVPRIPRTLRRLDQTLADIEQRRPAAIVTVDSWGFTGRVAKRLKNRGSAIPRIHYVAPMVWAWKEKRSLQLAERVDLLLCLLPQEPPYFTKVGLPAVHVGHAILESGAGLGDGAAFRARHGLSAEVPLLCVLPGSRHSETQRLLPIFAETVARLAVDHPGLQIVVPTVDTVAEEVRRAVWPVPATVVRGSEERYDAFAACSAALAASGTVALELALARLPMVIAYRVSQVTAMIIRRLIKIPYACLLNLMVGRMAIPELIQEDCRADRLAAELSGLMGDGPERAAQLAGATEALARLGLGGETPSRRAASEILAVINRKRV